MPVSGPILVFLANGMQGSVVMRAARRRGHDARALIRTQSEDICEQDRRRSWLTLTDTGRAVHAEIAGQRAAFNDELLVGFDAEERERLFAQLARMQGRAEALRSD